MPLQATSGAATYDAFGGGAAAALPTYIEEVFSTYLYTGNNPSSQTITNDIDLSGKGGLVWIKSRSSGTRFHSLYDTARGANLRLASNSTGAQQNDGAPSGLTFSSSGFVVADNVQTNESGGSLVSWTFREQPKFFDVVTWTGNATNRTIAHSLGAVPGSIIVKRTDTTADWAVYHRSLANTEYLVLNSTAAKATGATWWNSTTPTSSVFSVGTDASVNASGGTYVAYLFAHDAGGFGLAGTDNVISCGSFVSGAGGTCPPVNLGYEPQWVLYKNTANEVWRLADVMRGWSRTQSVFISPDQTSGDSALNNDPSYFTPTATGFQSIEPGLFTAGDTFIYIAIRRGPMKTPTLGTSVFSAVSRTGTSANATVTASISPVDMVLETARDANFGTAPNAFDRLRGANRLLITSTTGAEVDTTATPTLTGFDVQDGFKVGDDSGGYGINYSPYIFINWNFKRAPSFFDVVCYTGTGSATTFNHNLTVVPELMIVKRRSAAADWSVYSSALGNNKYLSLNDTIASSTTATYWNSTTPTSSVFTVGVGNQTNGSGSTYVAYLFATCAGVSKVGSYTGTGTTQTINCGFTAGSRFVLIKRTDSTGDWYVWDSTRGIVAGNDPYILLNSSAAEVTSTDYIDTYSAGFEISSTAPAAINANGGTYIFLAIA